jgi:excisionase family DNA binding protein
MKPAMSIAEAATLLNVSEEHLRALVAKGTLNTTADGSALLRDDVVSYRAARNEQREVALDEIVALGEEHDLPY